MTDFQKAIRKSPLVNVAIFGWVPEHVWAIACAWQYPGWGGYNGE
jgi:hypothetical protein